VAQTLLLADRAPEARTLMERAVELAKQTPNDHEASMLASEGLTLACRALNDLKCELKYAEQALDSCRQLPDSDEEKPLWLVHLLQDVGYARYSLRDIKGTSQVMEESVTVAATLHEKRPETLSHMENNVGSFYSRIGNFDKAKAHLDKALVLFREMYGNDSPQLAFILSNLAYVESRLGNYPESWKLFAEGQQLRERWQGPNHSDAIANEITWAASLAAGGDLRGAIQKSLHAERAAREHFVLSARVLPERQALNFRIDLQRGLSVAHAVVIKHPELGLRDVYLETIRSRALVADEMARRQVNVNRDNDPEIALLLRDLDQAREKYLHATTSSQAKPGELETAAQDLEHAERVLAEHSAAERSAQRTQDMSLADLRSGMPPRSVLVSYVAYRVIPVEAPQTTTEPPLHYGAYVFDPARDSISVFDLGEHSAIDDLVKRARGSVMAEMSSAGLGSVRTEREFRAAALELRQRIWDPLKNAIGDAAMVFIVPERRLNLIPFAALPDGDGYLVERPQVLHVLSTERDLLRQERTDRRTGLLAIGSPSFGRANDALLAKNVAKKETRDGALSCEEFQKLEFRPLPAASAEIQDVTSAWKRWNGSEPAQNIMGPAATRERFKQEVSRIRVLHIATHAYLLPESCGGDNPLMRSGLVFSGTGMERDSGLLTAQEIAGLDLTGLDWAVLSACNTGNGEVGTTEGVLGLQRAFRVAGARTVIMTLWPVDDNASRRFMRELYDERLEKHATTADAMWHATARMLQKQREEHASTHPWYWAGFVASGGWE
ncbi:MAG TPA: CHAT domain-containing tetratricopeptide repeat protein, partial [Candidatus Acidoferrales bacterium]|nr:CHAT domain-containing tetratricopeptide repeat protein [Candidatus Acidoferrales bacterium]